MLTKADLKFQVPESKHRPGRRCREHMTHIASHTQRCHCIHDHCKRCMPWPSQREQNNLGPQTEQLPRSREG